jgi:uncharacterized protein YdaU (DUF1376 family)
MLEHGAFTKLLDYYYSTEKPLPVDRCERIAGAYEPDEREAVQSVFFCLSDQGWVNAKADEVIAQFRSKSLKAKESAERRWKRTDSDGNANAYADAMLTQNSKPITQKKDQKQKPAARAEPFVDAPEWLDADAWSEWCQYRKGKKWTLRAQALSIAKLRELMLGGSDPPSVIRQSIAAGWTGLFPLKTGASHEANRKMSPADQVRAHIARADAAVPRVVNGHANAVAEDGRDLRPPLDGEFWREPGH